MKKIILTVVTLLLLTVSLIGCLNTNPQLTNQHLATLDYVLESNERYIIVDTHNMGYVQVETFLNMLPKDEYRLIAATSKSYESINFVILEKIGKE